MSPRAAPDGSGEVVGEAGVHGARDVRHAVLLAPRAYVLQVVAAVDDDP